MPDYTHISDIATEEAVKDSLKSITTVHKLSEWLKKSKQKTPFWSSVVAMNVAPLGDPASVAMRVLTDGISIDATRRYLGWSSSN